MKGSLYTLVYATVLGVVCSLLLTAAGTFTKKYRDANAKAEEIRNVLGVLGVPHEADASAADLVGIFEKAVKKEASENLTVFVYADPDSGAVKSVAVPFAGPGLWGPVEGFLSLEADRRTIIDISFYKQEETPGLGGEIAAACSCTSGSKPEDCAAIFRHQFRGKKIVGADGEPGMRVLRGTGNSLQVNEVDGIVGATMTCDKVQAMLNEAIQKVVNPGGEDAQ